MPAINFQTRFASTVRTHQKRQTIRRVWKRPIKPGDTLYLYTGMRTKRCRKLRTAKCTGVYPIKIDIFGIKMFDYTFILEGTADIERFAHRDGFSSWLEMRDWFKKRYGLPFEGVLITW